MYKMILSDTLIKEAISKGDIIIEPFRLECLGSNSYDVHLGTTLAIYIDSELDAKKTHKLHYFEIPEDGFLLQPGQFYLGVTEEYTETHKHVPFIECKSSIARLSLFIHHSAGKGDVGFCNHWTLEISCIKPVKIYPGMPIAQLIYFTIGEEGVEIPYNQKQSAKYTQRTNKPVESMMWKNF